MVILRIPDWEAAHTASYLQTLPVVGVLGDLARHIRVRGRPWRGSRRPSQHRRRVPHRPAHRPVGDDRLCPHHRLPAPAHGAALRHRWAQAAVPGRLCHLPRCSPALRRRGQHRHTDRVARAHGPRRIHDPGHLHGDPPLVLRRERARQGAGPTDKRRGCGRGRRAADRRPHRGAVRMAGSIPADGGSHGGRHRLRAGGPRPEEDGRGDYREESSTSSALSRPRQSWSCSCLR